MCMENVKPYKPPFQLWRWGYKVVRPNIHYTIQGQRTVAQSWHFGALKWIPGRVHTAMGKVPKIDKNTYTVESGVIHCFNTLKVAQQDMRNHQGSCVIRVKVMLHDIVCTGSQDALGAQFGAQFGARRVTLPKEKYAWGRQSTAWHEL